MQHEIERKIIMTYKRKPKIYDLNAMSTVELMAKIACMAFYKTYVKPHKNKFYFTNFLSDNADGMDELRKLVHLDRKRSLVSAHLVLSMMSLKRIVQMAIQISLM